jgi:hypothetical protein
MRRREFVVPLKWSRGESCLLFWSKPLLFDMHFPKVKITLSQCGLGDLDEMTSKAVQGAGLELSVTY